MKVTSTPFAKIEFISKYDVTRINSSEAGYSRYTGSVSVILVLELPTSDL